MAGLLRRPIATVLIGQIPHFTNTLGRPLLLHSRMGVENVVELLIPRHRSAFTGDLRLKLLSTIGNKKWIEQSLLLKCLIPL